jgi:hypothetical protein
MLNSRQYAGIQPLFPAKSAILWQHRKTGFIGLAPPAFVPSVRSDSPLNHSRELSQEIRPPQSHPTGLDSDRIAALTPSGCAYCVLREGESTETRSCRRLLQNKAAIFARTNRGYQLKGRGPLEGHFLVCHGQQGGNMFYFDPGPLTNNFQWNIYNWVVDGATHTWTHTLRTDESPNPPIPDIKVNGYDGTYYATTSTYLNMTVRLTDGLYAGTEADWWVLGYFSGVYVYLDQNGNWTTTPSTWSQSDLMVYTLPFSQEHWELARTRYTSGWISRKTV